MKRFIKTIEKKIDQNKNHIAKIIDANLFEIGQEFKKQFYFGELEERAQKKEFALFVNMEKYVDDLYNLALKHVDQNYDLNENEKLLFDISNNNDQGLDKQIY